MVNLLWSSIYLRDVVIFSRYFITTKTTTTYNIPNYWGFTNRDAAHRAKRERNICKKGILEMLRLIKLYNIFRIIWTSVSSFPSAASLTAAKKIYRVAWWRSTWPHSAQKQNICVLSVVMAVILRWVYCLLLVLYICLCKANYQEIALISSLHCAQGLTSLSNFLGEAWHSYYSVVEVTQQLAGIILYIKLFI